MFTHCCTVYVDLTLHSSVYIMHYGVLCTIWWPSVRYRRRYQLTGGGEEAYISAAHGLMEEFLCDRLKMYIMYVCSAVSTIRALQCAVGEISAQQWYLGEPYLHCMVTTTDKTLLCIGNSRSSCCMLRHHRWDHQTYTPPVVAVLQYCKGMCVIISIKKNCSRVPMGWTC